MTRTHTAILLSILVVVAAARVEAQWAQFRGPNGSGVDTATGYPADFSPTKNVVKTGGIITSLDATTGRLLKEGRNSGALGEYYASPVAADGKVFLANTEGKITVLRAAAQWDVIGVNDLGEEVHATPALSEGHLFVRTRSALFCFGTSR